jgi:hypothetical protein
VTLKEWQAEDKKLGKEFEKFEDYVHRERQRLLRRHAELSQYRKEILEATHPFGSSTGEGK